MTKKDIRDVAYLSLMIMAIIALNYSVDHTSQTPPTECKL